MAFSSGNTDKSGEAHFLKCAGRKRMNKGKKVAELERNKVGRELPGLAILYILTCCLWGGYHEYVSCGVSAALAVWLLLRVRRTGQLAWAKSAAFAAPFVLALAYLITGLWAQDRGMALIGFVKFLPLPLFALNLLQYKGEKEKCIETIPWVGVGMTVLSGAGSFLPIAEGHLTVAGRLAGFFEYPNTFALFLLLGIIVLATGEKRDWLPLAQVVVLLAGIFLSGSRTVFVLTAAALVCLAIWSRNRWMRNACRVLLPAGVGGAVAMALVTGNMDTVGRLLTGSLSSSTLLGRLLYAQDALTLVLKYPFGMGYQSYYYIQSSVQTGVYSVQFVHNDLLQCMLDVGWIPAAVLVFAIAKTALGRATPFRERLMLLMLCAHGLFDFSFQFISIAMTMLLLLDYGETRRVAVKKRRWLLPAAAGAVICVSLYFGAATFASFLGKAEAATAIYPGYTYNLVMQLQRKSGTDAELADRILKLDSHVAQAYYQKALACYEAGDFGGVIENQRLALENAPYALTYYEDYIQMLAVGVQLYTQAGSTSSAEICRRELQSVPQMLQQVQERTSALGWKIDDKPELTLPAEYQSLVKQFG